MVSHGEVLEAASHFRLGETPGSVRPLAGGLIHESWVVNEHHVLQRLNAKVFADLDAVMANLHVLSEALDLPTRPIRTTTGQLRWREWRALPYLEGVRRPGDVPPNDVVREIARAFGEFHRRATAAIDPAVLRVTIPGFHDPPSRLRALSQVIADDPAGRLAEVEPEVVAIDRVRRLAENSRAMQPPQVPQRVAHFDAKADNVLLDDRTGRVRAIVDLDTVMPGSVLWDVGDLARSLTATEAEDEPDPSRVTFHQERFDALLDGYRSEADAFLTPAEVSGLTLAPVVVTFEQAVRFLTDHLAGDTYYKIAHPGHNVQRARAQLALLDSMLAAGLGPGQ